MSIISLIKAFLRTDGKVMAPKLSWQTSSIGSNLRYLWNTCILDTFKPNKTGKEFQKIMTSKPTKALAKKACDAFTKETGIKMFMTDPTRAESFATNANILIRDIKSGKFPKDIKYVVIGHGDGTTLNNTWHVAFDPKIKIFDFINKHIPKGEKVLVNCCEETPKELKHLIPKNKPAIGKYTTEMYSSYKHPAKIVISGRNEIIGGYGNRIATYYI